jgi:uncharacterized protein YbjT (DUF2867 family)
VESNAAPTAADTGTTTARPVAVMGATGGQGGAVLLALRDAGRQVRAVVRDRRSRGARRLVEQDVELAEADLTDSAALTAALHGASAAFAVTTPFEAGPDQEVAQGEAIIAAAAGARLPHLVLASVASADQHTGIPHFDSKARIESRLLAADLEHTIVAPTYFFDNVAGDPAIAHGRLPLALPPDRALQQIDRADLGCFVAAVVAAPQRYRGRRVELAGDAPTPTEMAEAISAAAGYTVTHHQTPLVDVESRSPDLAAMFRFLTERGYSVDVDALHRAHPEITWTSFADWSQRQSWPDRATE